MKQKPFAVLLMLLAAVVFRLQVRLAAGGNRVNFGHDYGQHGGGHPWSQRNGEERHDRRVARTVQTGSQGQYTIPGLAPGLYDVSLLSPAALHCLRRAQR